MVDLPPEILESIFAYVHAQRDIDDREKAADEARRTLCSVSLACKAFRSAAYNALYHTIDVNDFQSGRLGNLLRTMMEHPQTSKLVREIYWHDDCFDESEMVWDASDEGADGENGDEVDDGSEDDDFLAPPSEDVLLHLLSTAEKLHLSSKLQQRLQRDLERGLTAAGVALLLGITVNLELLSMTMPSNSKKNLCMAVIAELAPELHSSDRTGRRYFTHLTDVDIMHQDPELGGSTNFDLVTVLRIPTLHTMKGYLINLREDFRFPPQLRSNVRHIALRSSTIQGDVWEGLFLSSPKLSTISIQWWSEVYDYGSEIDYNAMGEALRSHAHQLTALALDVREHQSTHPGRGCIRGLVELSSLSELFVPLQALVGDYKVGPLASMKDYQEHRNFIMGYGAFLKGFPSFSLVGLLPSSLRSLSIYEAEAASDLEQWLDFEVELLMTDERFERLTSIRLERTKPILNYTNAFGWEDGGKMRYRDVEFYSVNRETRTLL